MYNDLAGLLRGMQLFSHNAHNLVARSPFHSDHEFFGDVYASLENDYDDVIERMLGLYGEDSVDFSGIVSKAHNVSTSSPSKNMKENTSFYSHLLVLEKELCSLIEQVCSQNCSIGCQQLLGDIANRSEMRQYKIKQRIKK